MRVVLLGLLILLGGMASMAIKSHGLSRDAASEFGLILLLFCSFTMMAAGSFGLSHAIFTIADRLLGKSSRAP